MELTEHSFVFILIVADRLRPTLAETPQLNITKRLKMKTNKMMPILIALSHCVSANAQMANPVRPLPGVFSRASQASPLRDGP
jgi:hypothetical protein